jgi:tetratricopeptide (TPR) repeat protein
MTNGIADRTFTDLDKHELLQTLIATRVVASGLGRLVVKLAESIADKRSKPVAIAVAAQYLAFCGDADGAVALASRHLRGPAKALALVAIATELAHSNQTASARYLQEASIFLQEIEDEDDRVRLLQRLSNGYLDLRDSAMALHFARLVTQPSERAYTLCQIVKRLSDEGDAEKAVQILAEIRKAAEETGSPDRPTTWDSFARLLVHYGRHDEAVTAWDKAIKFIRESHDPDRLLVSICEALGSIGYMERAKEIALTIENGVRREQALSAIEKLE